MLTKPQEKALRDFEGYTLVMKVPTGYTPVEERETSWYTYKEFHEFTWVRHIKDFKWKTLGWNVAAELQNKGMVVMRMDKSNHILYLELTELGRLQKAKLESGK